MRRKKKIEKKHLEEVKKPISEKLTKSTTKSKK